MKYKEVKVMKANKLLILLAVLSMCVTGCNQKRNKSSSDFPSKSITPIDSFEPINSSKSEISSEELLSSSEPFVSSSSEIASSSNPYPHKDGFPSVVLNAFLTNNDLTDTFYYFIPEIADDQEWSYCMYSNFPILKLWTKDNTSGVSYEEQYYNIFVDAGKSITNRHYSTIGYCFVKDLSPTVAFKSVDGYFYIWVSAPAWDVKDTLDGEYPLFELAENFDLMNYGSLPSFPILELEEPAWRYQNFFDANKGVWKLFAGCDDLNSPDNTERTGTSLEDLYKELLESNGWTIDAHLYDNEGYFASKDTLEIQFFSWDNSFRTWVYKKL